MPGPIIFLGTGSFAVPLLKALVESGEKIPLAVTQPGRPSGRGRKISPTPVAEAAAALGLEVAEPENVNDHAFVKTLAALRPQYLILADYGQFLKAPILSVARGRAINLHPSLLPRWRGPSPVAYTLLMGDAKAGVSIMYMDEGMDSGPLLAQEESDIPANATTGELSHKLSEEGADLMVRTLAKLREGKIQPYSQDASNATYSRLIGPDHTTMDWSLDPARAAAHINALSPKPGMRAYLGGRLVKLLRAEPAEGSGEPARIIASGSRGLLVGSGGGVIRLLEVHPEGRKPMSARDYANSGDVIAAGRFQREPAQPV